MKKPKFRRLNLLILPTLIFLLSLGSLNAQQIQIGISVDPLFSWFTSDTKVSEAKGLRLGTAFGITVDSYFADNYAFSTGLSLINASGKISYTTDVELIAKNDTVEIKVPANKELTYRLQYLSIPLGIKLKTNQIGYFTFFSNIGLDPKIAIGRKLKYEPKNLTKESVPKELRLINLGFHITLGAEYSLGGNTSFSVGVSYENNFIDVTTDNTDAPYNQPKDKIKNNLIKLKLGLIF